jgi:hypothetical protein
MRSDKIGLPLALAAACAAARSSYQYSRDAVA